MKTKKGFTIIEILAVIVIIATITSIAVPAIFKITQKSQKNIYCSKLEIVQKSAERYADDNPLLNKCEIEGKEYNCESITIQDLLNDSYIDPDGIDGAFIDPRSKTAINTMEVLVYSKNDRSYAYVNETECPKFVTSALTPNELTSVKHTLTVALDGGAWNGTSPVSLKEESTLYVNAPTKAGFSFTGWTVSGIGSTINNGTFTMGTTDTTITANWHQEAYTLTVNANGGTWSGTTPQLISHNGTVTIANPVKSGTIFLGWTVSGTGSSISGTTFTMGSADTTIVANWLTYTYTGTSTLVDDGNGNWRIKFLTSGTFTPQSSLTIDLFLVGGGGGGGNITGATSAAGGGAGGYTRTWSSISLSSGTSYPIVVGAGGASAAAGGASSFNSTYSVNGGGTAVGTVYGGVGGSGGGGGGNSYNAAGAGGTNGSGGGNASTYTGGAGQGNTTREFGEVSGTLYAGAGGGGGVVNATYGAGGAGGGGAGGAKYTNGNPGTANTGGGGGGSGQSNYTNYGGVGGSGIVVIRNTQIFTVGDTTKYTFKAAGSYEIVNGSTNNWKIRFLGNTTFTPLTNMTIDLFLVGGGGGGGNITGATSAAGGGAGGYTGTWSSISLSSGTIYTITVGAGGATSFNSTYTVNGGGSAVGTVYGGVGGSGGGGGGNSYNVGGAGGTNGGAGGNASTYTGGAGQGTTTREFGEVSGTLYAGGGGGGGVVNATSGAGGAIGGGAGGLKYTDGNPGTANTGGGGGGSGQSNYTNYGGVGGSGIAIIRIHQ